ncbi:MAG TPA: type II toxin-antitoxin system VapC family toxin [Firmicutes bacterium]|nr:type II toxin-antitoxin system VapC family toxin [Bacillota bacterium]HHY99101.1 type II toxin-antitoxin system VapC family toxin [Bacillota bacterium]
MGVVCVDASLVVKWIVDEEESELALEILESWLSGGVTIISPTLLIYEVPSVLRKLTVKGKLTPVRAWEGFQYLGAIGIQIESSARLLLKAWEISMQFRMPTIYDAAYVALAEIKGCPLYTCDRRLIRAVHGRLPWVKGLTDQV